MNILITGGTGFIGSYLRDALLAQGYGITLLDLWEPEMDIPGVSFVHGDIRDPFAVREALQGCRSVFHLAAAHHDSGIERRTYFSVNEGGTKTLCQEMSSAGVSEVCFFSTVAVYGESGDHGEREVPAPSSEYGSSKFAAEKVLREWYAEDSRRKVLLIRPAMTFGPGNYANMYKLIRQIGRGRFYPVGSGANEKSMASVSNLVDATVYFWSKMGVGIDIYNYVDKPDMSSREIVEIIYSEIGKKPPPGSFPLGLALVAGKLLDGLGAVMGRRFAISSQGVRKLAGTQSVFPASRVSEVGFRPQLTLEDALKQMIAWCQQVPVGVQQERIPPPEVQVYR